MVVSEKGEDAEEESRDGVGRVGWSRMEKSFIPCRWLGLHSTCRRGDLD